mmetsp:Transcript_11668/g.16987  ORF Transcript_11668/g.16987 Transcript_11668/m.16987 type:complete len:93 (-) Transcript_11668:3477-3755(-)
MILILGLSCILLVKTDLSLQNSIQRDAITFNNEKELHLTFQYGTSSSPSANGLRCIGPLSTIVTFPSSVPIYINCGAGFKEDGVRVIHRMGP